MLRQVAALVLYVAASTLLVVTLRVVPDPGEPGGGVVEHMILAVRSAYFIGNPASSFSANVAMIRRALGAAPESSNLRVLDFPRPGSYK